MRRRPGGGMLACMDLRPEGVTHEGSDAIQIQLRLDGSQPAGVATGPDGGTRDFTGWVGLMAAVDALAMGEENTKTEDGEL